MVPIAVPKQVGPHNATATHDMGTIARTQVAPAIIAVALLPPLIVINSTFVSFRSALLCQSPPP